MKHQISAFIAFAIIANFIPIAHASIAVTTNGGSSGLFYGSVGFSFTVGTQDIEVYELGVYDHLNDGVNSHNEVDIWSNNGVLLASKIFPTGTGATYDQRFRWLLLAAPIRLDSNTTYRIAAFGVFEDRKSVLLPASGTTISSDITYVSGYINENRNSAAFPATSTGSQLIIGGNMRYNVVPEPATYALILLGLVPLLYRRKQI